jgi:ATP-dependent DNA helicase PIF1
MSQEEAFEKFKTGMNLFITGPGGTGKTTLVHRMTDYLGSRNMSYKVCALTGCAAILLGTKATTFHSWAGIGLARGTIKDVMKTVLSNSFAISRIKKTRVLFVDEISMMSKKLFDLFCEIVRHLNPSMQIIFTGDFFQLPPVGNVREPDTSAFCFESEHWESIFPIESHIELTHIYRQNDPVYIELLQSVRRGSITEGQADLLRGKVGTEPIATTEEVVSVVPPKLYAIKRQVDTHNYMAFAELEGDMKEYTYSTVTNLRAWVDTGVPIKKEILDMCARLSPTATEYELNNILSIMNCREKLQLKVGCSVMLILNLDLENGLCNGTQGVVTGFNRLNEPLVKFNTGTLGTAAPVTVSHHTWQSDTYPTLGIRMMPLILSWAVTIHKIQGATLESAVMDLGNTVFEYGQMYVALSRVKSLDGLYLEGFNHKKIKANPKVIEFYETLFNAQLDNP